jgi:predicted nucleic acid-binding Zn ribbon protein
MAKKRLGFIPLIWTCAYCETQNPGPIKTCTSCGAPQPEDVEFTQVDEETFNFIKDEALIRMAQAGPDIHCPYCGTRNPATAETCSNCGGDLSMGGKARETGAVVQTTTEAAQTPPPTPEPTQKTSSGKKGIFIVIGLVAILACIIGAIMLFTNTDDISATVTGRSWERSIIIESYQTVSRSDWSDEIPAGAEVESCTQKYRYTSDEPATNATEVCGEPYVEDTGTGFGEVVQDCTYEVYDDYCDYTILDWVPIETVSESGDFSSPEWPSPGLISDQRLGQREESYTIVFRGDGETYTYTTDNVDLFLSAELGSQWTLSINQLGGIQSLKLDN